MNALILTLFVSSALAVLAVLLFAHAVRNRSQDHADRLSLLPLGGDDGDAALAPTALKLRSDLVDQEKAPL